MGAARSAPPTSPGRGRPRVRPDRVAEDKGYSSRKLRRYLRRRSTGGVIPPQKRERRTRFDKIAYRARHLVERPTFSSRSDEHVQAGYHAVGWMFTFRRKRFVGS